MLPRCCGLHILGAIINVSVLHRWHDFIEFHDLMQHCTKYGWIYKKDAMLDEAMLHCAPLCFGYCSFSLPIYR